MYLDTNILLPKIKQDRFYLHVFVSESLICLLVEGYLFKMLRDFYFSMNIFENFDIKCQKTMLFRENSESVPNNSLFLEIAIL